MTLAGKVFFTDFVKRFPLVLDDKVLSQEVPYQEEVNLYVEGLRFPDTDFDGMIKIHLSLLEPIAEVRRVIRGGNSWVFSLLSGGRLWPTFDDTPNPEPSKGQERNNPPNQGLSLAK